MSKNARIQQAKNTKKVELQKDLETQLEAAQKAQLEKLHQSKVHLIEQLNVASEKYLTVNGFMQARSTFDMACSDDSKKRLDGADGIVRRLAQDMSSLTADLARNISKIDVKDLDDSVLDGYLDKRFVEMGHSMQGIAKQLLVVNLLQNVGPSIDDITAFRVSTDEAINAIRAKLTEVMDEAALPGQSTVEEQLMGMEWEGCVGHADFPEKEA